MTNDFINKFKNIFNFSKKEEVKETSNISSLDHELMQALEDLKKVDSFTYFFSMGLMRFEESLKLYETSFGELAGDGLHSFKEAYYNNLYNYITLNPSQKYSDFINKLLDEDNEDYSKVVSGFIDNLELVIDYFSSVEKYEKCSKLIEYKNI